MAGTRIRKTKKSRPGPGIDERIEAMMGREEIPPTHTQWGFSGLTNNQGPGGDIPQPPASAELITDQKTATAVGGAAVFTFDLVTEKISLHAWYDCVRTSYAEAGNINVIYLSSSVSMLQSRTRLPATGTAEEFTVAASVGSSKIVLTFTNNHATEDLTVTLHYIQSEAA